MKKMHVSTLIVALLLPLLVGMISAFISSGRMDVYGTMMKPPLSPPAWLFPIAWTILYLLMGLSSYYVYASETDVNNKLMPLFLYGIQLAMNFMWSIIFFNWHMYLFAFIWLLILWFLVILCTYEFSLVNKMAAILMIPYILWLTFAAYLNLGAYILLK